MKPGTMRWMDVDGEEVYRCPTSLVRGCAVDVGEVLTVWREWRDTGMYPNAGGRFCQSGKLLDLFEELDRAERGRG